MDPTGEIAFVPILVGIGVSMVADYLYDEYLSDHVNDFIDDNFDCDTQEYIGYAGNVVEGLRSVKNPVKAAKNLNKVVKKTKKSKKSKKEKSTDTPSWSKGQTPNQGESGKDFAKRLMDKRYGSGNYQTGPGSEFSKLKKFGDRSQ